MTLGVGGSTPEQALARLQNMMAGAEPISEAEYQVRIARAQALMREQDIAALFLAAGSNLQYFTGVHAALVALHVAGASICTAATAALWASMRERTESAPLEGVLDPDDEVALPARPGRGV